MKLIDADAFDALLVDAQRRAKNNFQYGFLSSVRENLAMMPESEAYKEARERIENMAGIIEDQQERIDIMAADMPIHCKDCKYFQEGIDINGKPFTRCNCEKKTPTMTWGASVTPDWFCANAEPKEDDDDADTDQ